MGKKKRHIKFAGSNSDSTVVEVVKRWPTSELADHWTLLHVEMSMLVTTTHRPKGISQSPAGMKQKLVQADFRSPTAFT